MAEEAYKDDRLNFLLDLVADIEAREEALRERERVLKSRETIRLDQSTVENQVQQLVNTAKAKLDDPTQETLVELFDLIELDLVRVGDHRFEGTASIPLPPDGGEVWAGGPQPLYSNLTGLEFPLHVTA